MAWPPSYITLNQSTQIKGSVMFKKGSLITSDGIDVMKIIRNEVTQNQQNKFLLTDNNKVLTTEDNNNILV